MPTVEIHVKGKIDPNWSEWFDDLSIVHDMPDETVLKGQLVDKAAVYGVLSRLSSLGLSLISVQCQDIEKENG